MKGWAILIGAIGAVWISAVLLRGASTTTRANVSGYGFLGVAAVAYCVGWVRDKFAAKQREIDRLRDENHRLIETYLDAADDEEESHDSG